MISRNLTSLSLAAAVLLGASGAHATLVHATAQDEFTYATIQKYAFNYFRDCVNVIVCDQSNPDYVVVGGSLGYVALSHADFIFDTDLGIVTHDADGSETLTWTSAMGTPSPLLTGTFATSGTGIFAFSQDLSDATEFTITRSFRGLGFVISGADYRFAAGRVDLRAVPDGATYSLEEAYNPAFYDYGFYSFDSATKGPVTLLSQYQQIATLTPLSVPEPATWAMLTLGFAGLGSVLRLARRPTPKLAA